MAAGEDGKKQKTNKGEERQKSWKKKITRNMEGEGRNKKLKQEFFVKKTYKNPRLYKLEIFYQL